LARQAYLQLQLWRRTTIATIIAVIGTGAGIMITTGIGIGTAIAIVTVIGIGIAAGAVMSTYRPESTLIPELIPTADTMAVRMADITAVRMGAMAATATTVVEASATGSRRAIGMDSTEEEKTPAADDIQLPTTLSTLGTAMPHTGRALLKATRLAFGSMPVATGAFNRQRR